MAEAVLMLALSPTMEEGTITRWHKKEGEAVARKDHFHAKEDNQRVHFDLEQFKISYWSRNEKDKLNWAKSMGGIMKIV